MKNQMRHAQQMAQQRQAINQEWAWSRRARGKLEAEMFWTGLAHRKKFKFLLGLPGTCWTQRQQNTKTEGCMIDAFSLTYTLLGHLNLCSGSFFSEHVTTSVR